AGLEGARSAATLSDPIHSGVTDPGVIQPGELFEEGAAAQSNAVRRERLRAPSNVAVGKGLPSTGAAPQTSPAQVKQSRGQARAGKLAAVSGTSHTASPPPLKAKRAGVAEASPGRARRAPRRKPT
ncbi:MAG: hypothetical protein ACKOFW_22465, partial [Planctomycetaceae bacterium]